MDRFGLSDRMVQSWRGGDRFVQSDRYVGKLRSGEKGPVKFWIVVLRVVEMARRVSTRFVLVCRSGMGGSGATGHGMK